MAATDAAAVEAPIANVVVPTEPAALQAWLADGGYKAWPRESGKHESAGPHGDAVLTFLTPALVASLKRGKGNAHPRGVSAVKELYEKGVLNGWAVSVKLADDSADGRTGTGTRCSRPRATRKRSTRARASSCAATATPSAAATTTSRARSRCCSRRLRRELGEHERLPQRRAHVALERAEVADARDAGVLGGEATRGDRCADVRAVERRMLVADIISSSVNDSDVMGVSTRANSSRTASPSAPAA